MMEENITGIEIREYSSLDALIWDEFDDLYEIISTEWDDENSEPVTTVYSSY